MLFFNKNDAAKRNAIKLKKEELQQIDDTISKLQKALDQAKADLKTGVSAQEALDLYSRSYITKEYYDEIINSIDKLNFMITSLPKSMQLTIDLRNTIITEIERLKKE